MNVILLEKINKLGDIGDQVAIKSGFGRNYLIPFGKAVPATKANIADFDARRGELEKVAAEKRSIADARAARLAELTISFSVKASDEGKLFGSITARDVAEAITEAGVEVSKSEVRMPDGPIHALGECLVNIQIHSVVTQTVTVVVVAEE